MPISTAPVGSNPVALTVIVLLVLEALSLGLFWKLRGVSHRGLLGSWKAAPSAKFQKGKGSSTALVLHTKAAVEPPPPPSPDNAPALKGPEPEAAADDAPAKGCALLVTFVFEGDLATFDDASLLRRLATLLGVSDTAVGATLSSGIGTNTVHVDAEIECPDATTLVMTAKTLKTSVGALGLALGARLLETPKIDVMAVPGEFDVREPQEPAARPKRRYEKFAEAVIPTIQERIPVLGGRTSPTSAREAASQRDAGSDASGIQERIPMAGLSGLGSRPSRLRNAGAGGLLAAVRSDGLGPQLGNQPLPNSLSVTDGIQERLPTMSSMRRRTTGESRPQRTGALAAALGGGADMVGGLSASVGSALAPTAGAVSSCLGALAPVMMPSAAVPTASIQERMPRLARGPTGRSVGPPTLPPITQPVAPTPPPSPPQIKPLPPAAPSTPTKVVEEAASQVAPSAEQLAARAEVLAVDRAAAAEKMKSKAAARAERVQAAKEAYVQAAEHQPAASQDSKPGKEPWTPRLQERIPMRLRTNAQILPKGMAPAAAPPLAMEETWDDRSPTEIAWGVAREHTLFGCITAILWGDSPKLATPPQAVQLLLCTLFGLLYLLCVQMRYAWLGATWVSVASDASLLQRLRGINAMAMAAALVCWPCVLMARWLFLAAKRCASGRTGQLVTGAAWSLVVGGCVGIASATLYLSLSMDAQAVQVDAMLGWPLAMGVQWLIVEPVGLLLFGGAELLLKWCTDFDDAESAKMVVPTIADKSGGADKSSDSAPAAAVAVKEPAAAKTANAMLKFDAGR